MLLIKKEEDSTKLEGKIYFWLISKLNDDVIGIAVSMWEWHDIETILTYNDVMNIKDSTGKWFG